MGGDQDHIAWPVYSSPSRGDMSIWKGQEQLTVAGTRQILLLDVLERRLEAQLELLVFMRIVGLNRRKALINETRLEKQSRTSKPQEYNHWKITINWKTALDTPSCAHRRRMLEGLDALTCDSAQQLGFVHVQRSCWWQLWKSLLYIVFF